MSPESCSQHLWAPGAGPSGWVKMRLATVTVGHPHPPQRPCLEQPSLSSSLRGPPGHAEDRIADGLELPELQVGDWLIFEDMGAYTMESTDPLGEGPLPHITYAMSRLAW